MSNLKHVYILGAGFSMPLGGPSFNQLVSKTEERKVIETLGDFELGNEGQFFREMDEVLTSLWKAIGKHGPVNLEELLEIVDYADQVSQVDLRRVIVDGLNFCCGHSERKWRDRDMRNVGRIIRHRIAISTTLFHEQVPETSERWMPYKKWFSSLTTDDTIITFNYDSVVERAAKLSGRPYYENSCTPLALTDPRDGKPSLLKLHGSSDWYFVGDVSNKTIGDIVVGRCDWREYFRQEMNIMIGTPGLAKPTMSAGVFRPLWEKAEMAIQQADIVSLVGYSIPATDNLAKALIEDNLAAATNLKAVNVVLGPSAGTPLAFRVTEILTQACAGLPKAPYTQSRVKTWYRYSQDFIHRYRPKNSEDLLTILIAQ